METIRVVNLTGKPVYLKIRNSEYRKVEPEENFPFPKIKKENPIFDRILFCEKFLMDIRSDTIYIAPFEVAQTAVSFFGRKDIFFEKGGRLFLPDPLPPEGGISIQLC